MNGLKDKIAIITGGTQGLGAAIAMLFGQRSTKGIVICGRNTAKGNARADKIRKTCGAEVVYQQADFGKVEDSRAVVAGCDKAVRHGGYPSSMPLRSLTLAPFSTHLRNCLTRFLPSTCAHHSS